MAAGSTYNILMYSHDTYGLGHIRRTMAIADHLRGPNVNILILTGSPIAGRFSFPDQVDFVRIPGMIKKTNDEYLPMSIKIDARQALDIRTNIITATAKTFRPHLFIVDKEPLGLKREILPTLEWMREYLPGSRTILGLRDIMDDAETIRHDWEKKDVYRILDSLYHEIWVYGLREYYDPIAEYAIPAAVSAKIHFTGYIPRRKADPATIQKIKKEYPIRPGEKLIVVTTGGGGDGYKVMDNYLSMIETETLPDNIKSVLVTGPFMPKRQRKCIDQRARRYGIHSHRFYRSMIDLMAAADLVVSMGGYNTSCEILSQATVSLLIPREEPRKEQLIRARVFQQHDLVDYIPWSSLTPVALKQKVMALLEDPGAIRRAVSRFDMTGFHVMRKRLAAFRNGRCPDRLPVHQGTG
ncbi:MAG: glycosyltransferase family protein [Thermodesulfobacteriota bacterium]